MRPGGGLKRGNDGFPNCGVKPNRPKPKAGNSPNFSKPTTPAARFLANSIRTDAIPDLERRKMATGSVHAQTPQRSITEQKLT